MCLTSWTTEKDPRQGSPVSAWTGGATEKDRPKRPSHRQLQEAQKKRLWEGHNSCRRGSLCPCTLGAARVPASQAAAPPSLATLSGESCHRQKKKKKNLASSCTGSLRSCPTLCNPIDCGLPGFSVRGLLQARILECMGPNWLPYLLEHCISCCPSCQLSTWCCQNPCNPSSCTTSTPGPPRGRPKPSRAASGANPSGRPTCRGGNKATVETQGQCG